MQQENKRAHGRFRPVLLATLMTAVVAVIAIASGTSAAPRESVTAHLPVILGLPKFEARPYGGSFTRITDIEHAGDARLFVTEQAGLIKILHPNGQTTTFMDLRDRVVVDGAEMGLLAIVFHPDYQTNGQFFVSYTGRDPSVGDWNLYLSRFQVSANPDVGDRDSEEILMRIEEGFELHNGGGMAFSPLDGYLYFGVGDDSQLLVAQDPKNRKGKILQVDVSGGSPAEYEVYALGLRNPWRFAIDPKSGNMYIGDVGDLEWEEVDVIHYGSPRLNFGWPCVEGPEIRFDGGECANPERHQLPVYAYKHANGRCAVIGGPIFRPGDVGPANFLFGDFCSREVWVMTPDATGAFNVEKLGTLTNLPSQFTTFGTSVDGRFFVGPFGANLPLYELIIP